MTYKTGSWGKKAIERSRTRLEYFKQYGRKRNKNRRKRLGYLGEQIAQKLLPGSRIVNKYSHDIKVGGKKIEVKTANLITSKDNVRQWRFCITKQKNKADYFMFLCFNENKLMHIYFMPNSSIKQKDTLYIYPHKLEIFDDYELKGGDI